MEEDIEILENILKTKEYGLCEITDTFYKAIENLLKAYTGLVKVSTETAFDTVNEDTEFLCRLLLKQGQLEFNKEKFEYINPRQNKEFEVNGIMYTKEKIFFINDDELDDYTKQLEEKNREQGNIINTANIAIKDLQEKLLDAKSKIEELKQEITVLQNTKDTCPSLNTSGVRCSLKESLPRRNGKTIELAITLREEILKLPECKLYGIKNCKGRVILLTKEEVIPKSKVKEKVEELKEKQIEEFKKYDYSDTYYHLTSEITALQELLEEETK